MVSKFFRRETTMTSPYSTDYFPFKPFYQWYKKHWFTPFYSGPKPLRFYCLTSHLIHGNIFSWIPSHIKLFVYSIKENVKQ